jgi:hypothetical protein
VRNQQLITLTPEAEAYVRGQLFSSPRELSGWVLSAIENTLNEYEGSDPSAFIDTWYRSAEVASYDSTAAAAAYLGAYGPRSILKYQEAVFALSVLHRGLRQHNIVIDYGAGPCIGLAALVDLWAVLTRVTTERLSLEYVAVDRSISMLEVGETLCRLVTDLSDVSISYNLLHVSEFTSITGNLLIVSNVMNDGEGNIGGANFLSPLVEAIADLEDVVVIEPATEQASSRCAAFRVLYLL